MISNQIKQVFFLFIHFLYHLSIRVTEKLKPIPAGFKQEIGDTTGRSPVYCSADTQMIHTHIHNYGQVILARWPSLYVFGLEKECPKKPARHQPATKLKQRNFLLWDIRTNHCITVSLLLKSVRKLFLKVPNIAFRFCFIAATIYIPKAW